MIRVISASDAILATSVMKDRPTAQSASLESINHTAGKTRAFAVQQVVSRIFLGKQSARIQTKASEYQRREIERRRAMLGSAQ
jgi:hypothetical protein